MNNFKNASPTDVVAALEEERSLAATAAGQFEIMAIQSLPVGEVLTIRKSRGIQSPEVIDALEGLEVRWMGIASRASPTVVVVSAENAQVHFKGPILGPHPAVGDCIWVRFPDFLFYTIQLWKRVVQGQRFIAELERFNDDNMRTDLMLEQHPLADRLVEEQRIALSLANFVIAYIWGTAGAGKTMTIATLIIAFMAKHPDALIMVCTTSNKGVDEVAIRTAKHSGAAFHIQRIGSGYDKQRYEDYPQLLSAKDPFSTSEQGWSAEEGDAVLPGMYAFTAAGAMKRFDLLAEQKWDLLIADEASQISLAVTLPLMSLAERVIFVGDPKQCSPVAKTRNPFWRSIVGESAFAFMPKTGPRMVMLTRQARMPEIVGSWAGYEFYDDKVTLMHEVANNDDWQKFRKRPFGRFSADQHFILVKIPNQPEGLQGNCVREWSARVAIHLIREDRQLNFGLDEITYITPYNDQVLLMSKLLHEAGMNAVVRTTAHKLQGGESPIVFMDPVNATGAFMKSEIGAQILNVGPTRTQCKLIWLVSEDDLTHPNLTRLKEFAGRTNQLLGDLPEMEALP